MVQKRGDQRYVVESIGRWQEAMGEVEDRTDWLQLLKAIQRRWLPVQGVIGLWNWWLHVGVDPQSLHDIKERIDKFTGEKALQCQ